MKRIYGLFALICLLTFAMSASATVWEVPGDFDTIQEAIDDANVLDEDTIRVGPGSQHGAYVDKSVEIKGRRGAIIDTGPMHPAGLSMGFRLLEGSDGAIISKLTFTVDLAIMNGEAVDDVTVTRCKFYNAIQAVSNWRGSGWEISRNRIYDLRTRCGGGIGILVADFSGGVVEDNLVSRNKIRGTLTVPADDCGGYNGSGIVLFADFRWGGAGAEAIKNNIVSKNKVKLVTDNQGSADVDVVAFELTDTRDDVDADPYPVIFDNNIGFNHWKGTALQMDFTPEELEGENLISRNIGDNRAHDDDAHPSVFR
jgi:hypothetical protein